MSRRHLTVFRWVWTTLLVLVTSAPYCINWWSTPTGYHYTWILPPYPEDSFGYMAWAQQAANGAWLFKIKYTALAHGPFLFHPFFLICGWCSFLLSCEIGIVFFGVKAIGVALFLLAFYRYVDYLGLKPSQSVAASIAVGVSSGVGGILFLSGVTRHWAVPPTDLWMPEVSTFWSLLWNPLFPFSLTLMLLSIFWLDRGTQHGRMADLWRSGLAAGVMALLHPYSVPLLFAWATIVTIARKKRQAAGYLWRYFAAALPFATYLAAVSRLNPLLARHSVMGEMKSPPVAAYALGFGLPLLLLMAGLAVFRSQLLKRHWPLILWFFLAVMLAYFPFWFQRKLVFGAQIPLCILAGVVLDSLLARWFPKSGAKWAWVTATVLLLPLIASTSCYLLFSENDQVRANKGSAYYVNDDIVEGLKILRDRSAPDEVVFATPGTSRLIPAWSGSTVVWGHWAMSVDYKERQAALANSIGVGSYLPDDERARLFWESGIQLIFADGELKEFIERHPFVWGAILKDAPKIFENQSVVIYQHEKGS